MAAKVNQSDNGRGQEGAKGRSQEGRTRGAEAARGLGRQRPGLFHELRGAMTDATSSLSGGEVGARMTGLGEHDAADPSGEVAKPYAFGNTALRPMTALPALERMGERRASSEEGRVGKEGVRTV